MMIIWYSGKEQQFIYKGFIEGDILENTIKEYGELNYFSEFGDEEGGGVTFEIRDDIKHIIDNVKKERKKLILLMIY